ncbi:MAG TPA: TolC family protein [bacterium]|nr:TolC family protein [bacterium]
MNRHTLVSIVVAALLAAGPGMSSGAALAAPAPASLTTSAQGQTPSGPAGPTLTLDQAIQQALTHNPQVTAAQQALAAAQQGITIARTGLAPTVSLNGSGNYGTASGTTVTSTGIAQVLPSAQGTGSVSFVGSVPLFDGGRTTAEVGSATAGVAIAEAALRLTQQSIALQTATAFFNVLSAEKLTDVRRAQLKQNQDQLAQTQAQVKAGVAAQSDVIQVQSQVAQAQVNLLSAQSQIATSKAALQALLAADVAAAIEVQAPPAPPPAVSAGGAAVVQQALANRPEVAQAQAQVQSAQSGLDLARVNAGPQMSLAINTSYTPVSTNAALSNGVSYGLGGTVSLPLYDAGKGRAEIQQAQATLQSAQASLSAAQLSVRQDAYQSYLNAVQAAANVTATQAAAAAADAALQVAQGQYRAGVGTILNVTTAEANAAQAEVNAVSAVYSYQTALATLLHSEGLPIQSSALGGTQ